MTDFVGVAFQLLGWARRLRRKPTLSFPRQVFPRPICSSQPRLPRPRARSLAVRPHPPLARCPVAGLVLATPPVMMAVGLPDQTVAAFLGDVAL